MKHPLLLCLAALVFLFTTSCDPDAVPLPNSGRILVSVNGQNYTESLDVVYDYREEEGEDVAQAHLLPDDEIGFSLVLRSPGEGSMSTGFFSPDTADGLRLCSAILVLNEDDAYDAVRGRAQVITWDTERNAASMSFDFVMRNTLGGDSLEVSGSVQNALILRQE